MVYTDGLIVMASKEIINNMQVDKDIDYSPKMPHIAHKFQINIFHKRRHANHKSSSYKMDIKTYS